MADNAVRYGFRWFRGRNGVNNPKPIECFVDTGTAFNILGTTGGTSYANVALKIGDLVTRSSTGHVTLCVGAETTAAGSLTPVFGVVAGIKSYYDSTKGVMTIGKSLPSGVAWGTNFERQTKVYVIPIEQGYWEVDVDSTATATTLPTYQVMVGGNVDFKNCGASVAEGAAPRISISSIATTSTLHFRIAEVSPTQDNVDYSGAYVKLIVESNASMRPNATGTAGI